MAKKKKKAAKNKSSGGKSGGGLKALASNPLAAEVVAAALVATAAALRDTKRARQLAGDTGEEIAKLSKAGAKRGEELWDMALDIGRRSLEALSADKPRKPARGKPAKTKGKPAGKKRSSTAKGR